MRPEKIQACKKNQILYGPEFLSGLISTTISVVFIVAGIAYISRVIFVWGRLRFTQSSTVCEYIGKVLDNWWEGEGFS